jgi:hypothetical protein
LSARPPGNSPIIQWPPSGHRLTLEARIAEILERYPADDPVHRAISRSRPVLAAAVERGADCMSAKITAGADWSTRHC